MRYTYDNRVKPIFFLHDLEKGTRRQVLADPKRNVTRVLWAPTGKGFYVGIERTSRPELAQNGFNEALYYDLATGKEAPLDLGWERGLARQEEHDDRIGLVPLNDGFLALLANGVRPRLRRYAWQNGRLAGHWVRGEHAAQVFGLAASTDGKRV